MSNCKSRLRTNGIKGAKFFVCGHFKCTWCMLITKDQVSHAVCTQTNVWSKSVLHLYHKLWRNYLNRRNNLFALKELKSTFHVGRVQQALSNLANLKCIFNCSILLFQHTCYQHITCNVNCAPLYIFIQTNPVAHSLFSLW